MSSQDTKLKLLANAIFSMPSKRYLTYIRSKQWSDRRKEYLDSIEWWCEHCKKRPAFQCHHFSYANLGNESPSDLYGVCVQCHNKLHKMVFKPAANDNKQYDLFTKADPDDEAA